MDMKIGAQLVRAESLRALPREVQLLLRREREVATIVYELGAASGIDVQKRLTTPLANASVRSMLNRLVAKGILTRFPSGRRFLYLPALSRTESGRRALIRFADDHFAGSLEAAAFAMQEILADS